MEKIKLKKKWENINFKMQILMNLGTRELMTSTQK